MFSFHDWKIQYSSKVVFQDDYKKIKDTMREVMSEYKRQGKKMAIWGGGMKGTSFLKIVDARKEFIEFAIDIKREKSGNSIAGRQIVCCHDLEDKDVDVVFMMNQRHFVQNYNILKDRGIECIVHDMDEIVKHGFSADEIIHGLDMKSDNEENKKITRQIQRELLPLLKEVKRVCEKNNITYFLCAGSVLGAVRHKGFIPWDDDIDVGMLRKDYIRFMEIAKRELSDGFLVIDSLDTPNYYVGHSKIFRDNTALVDKSMRCLKIHHGLYLDIFPFDTLPEQETERHMFYKQAVRINEKFYFKRRKVQYGIKNPLVSFWINEKYHKAKFKSAKRVFGNLNEIFTRYLDTDNEMVADLFAPYKKELFYKKSDILPVKKMMFEGEEYPVPCNTDAYLTTMYGDYMELPPENKRYVKHDIICFDTEHNYEKDKKWMKKFYKNYYGGK